jgi:hypothetical protein
MSETEQRLESLVAQNEYAKAAVLAEEALDQIPQTPFHKIIGRNLLHLTEGTANYISGFFSESQKHIAVKAMYFEMNGFSINPDEWFFNSFAFSFCGNPDDPEDTDWLADYEFSPLGSDFQITGYEDLQEVCAYFLKNWRECNSDAQELFEYIVTIRFIELIANAVQFAKDHELAWKDIPIFGTTHDSALPFLYRSNCK